MQYIAEFDDEAAAAIDAARMARNNELPQTVAGEPDEEGNPTQVPNPDLINSVSGYIDFVVSRAVDSYKRQFAQVIPALPSIPPTTIGSVPQVVSRRQAMQALRIRGLREAAQAAIDGIPDPLQRGLMQDEWDQAQTFERHRPQLIMMAAAIGLDTDEKLDELFVFAATL
jgi:hypothetical protein